MVAALCGPEDVPVTTEPAATASAYALDLKAEGIAFC